MLRVCKVTDGIYRVLLVVGFILVFPWGFSQVIPAATTGLDTSSIPDPLGELRGVVDRVITYEGVGTPGALVRLEELEVNESDVLVTYFENGRAVETATFVYREGMIQEYLVQSLPGNDIRKKIRRVPITDSQELPGAGYREYHLGPLGELLSIREVEFAEGFDFLRIIRESYYDGNGQPLWERKYAPWEGSQEDSLELDWELIQHDGTVLSRGSQVFTPEGLIVTETVESPPGTPKEYIHREFSPDGQLVAEQVYSGPNREPVHEVRGRYENGVLKHLRRTDFVKDGERIRDEYFSYDSHGNWVQKRRLVVLRLEEGVSRVLESRLYTRKIFYPEGAV
ncbi:hypothetical protein [Spirochaeta lutea]|uniref:Uncharacterized protein n=1 Tax=Spirochaeta lutea TaxID=1480694 RepID=A0A098QUW9_9SPIO|nr:hypothetical protein [Spirochaeta lutea]KGE71655.1 hypothetical protein DC28_10335 [Spirochaeta lutea]